ncbi:toprim domain-containing protein [Hydrogenophaga sp. BPS33]|uniref:toprim domain-containing protein n=1 Tax=Hydrogenophaga sp. BPS33 TaxID=2651974 RepID=UPI00131FF7E7|nr:toprim domain-containing protein [Hydrogenophaga sp. BPS33]QHE86521.1 toprim domain-containing protein [Hydrogenophaga sp. BPS33]
MIVWTDHAPGDHRIMCPACGKKPSVKDMGITILDDSHGVAHCFKCGIVLNRREDRELSPAERKAFSNRMNELRRQHAAEQLRRQAQAADASARRWATATPVGDHPYLQAKGVQAHGLRVDACNNLLIPLRDAAGNLHSLQSIAADGSKRFMPGGRVKGCYHPIGKPSGRLIVCEGYATGATLHEVTDLAVAVAFNAGNLLPVAAALRSKFPSLILVVAADDDWTTDGNPGLTAATEAARAVGGLLALPQFGDLPRGAKDTDFNDLHRLGAAVEVQS